MFTFNLSKHQDHFFSHDWLTILFKDLIVAALSTTGLLSFMAFSNNSTRPKTDNPRNNPKYPPISAIKSLPV